MPRYIVTVQKVQLCDIAVDADCPFDAEEIVKGIVGIAGEWVEDGVSVVGVREVG